MCLEDVGRVAAEHLLSAINGEPTHGVHTVPCRLVVRQSTDPETRQPAGPETPPAAGPPGPAAGRRGIRSGDGPGPAASGAAAPSARATRLDGLERTFAHFSGKFVPS